MGGGSAWRKLFGCLVRRGKKNSSQTVGNAEPRRERPAMGPSAEQLLIQMKFGKR